MENLEGRRVTLSKNQYDEGEFSHNFKSVPENWFKKRIGKKGIIKNVSTGFFNITVKFDEDGYSNDFNIKELILINPNRRIS